MTAHAERGRAAAILAQPTDSSAASEAAELAQPRSGLGAIHERNLRLMFDHASYFVGLVRADGIVLEANRAALNFAGTTRADVVGRPFWETAWFDDKPALKERMRQALADAARGEVQRFEIELDSAAGRIYPFEVTLTPIKDESGQVVLIIPEGRDISEHRRHEDELGLLQTITQAFTEVDDLHQALGIALREVCHVTGWVLGQAWIPSADREVLEFSPAWCDCQRGMAEYRHASMKYAPRPGRGLLGRAWESRQPFWVRDVSVQDTFQRADDARRSGLKAGLAVPVLADDEVVAVLEFYMREVREQDERLVSLVSTVAAQLGSVVRRKQAEAEREQLLRLSEAAEARFRSLVESAPDAIVSVDHEGLITLVNRQAELLFGYSRAELVGQPIELLVPERFRAIHASHRDRYNKRPAPREMGSGLALYGRRRNGDEFPAEISLSVVQSDHQVQVTTVIRDITTRKMAEAERDSLERQKDEFLGNVSHDLRTPLAAIKASIGVVLANEPPETPTPLHRMFANIDAAADRMVKLVGDLLELTRLQAGRGQLRPDHADLRVVAQRALRAIEPLVAEKNQRLVARLPSRPLRALVDAERLERALLNLLSNAQKYSPVGSTITMRLQRRQDEVLIAVADQGPGIPEHDQRFIFERFYRSQTEVTRRNEGSGLGLPIARAMVELHGGHIWVESRPGHGATFWVALPLREPSGRAAARRKAQQ